MAAAVVQGMKGLALDDKYLLVAAIDFGTTFSGYAFSFKSNQKNIIMNKNWGAEVSMQSHKTTTCVFTKPGGDFQSFGYEAEHDFTELDEDDVIGGPDGYNLYRHFKMLLHEQGAKLSSTVTSTSGHVTKAIDIFSMSLRYLKNHMLQAIGKAVKTPPTAADIRWVLTVPAIWTDESKRFMREAAFRAGLILKVDSKQLLIALEPEAASAYCRQLEMEGFSSGAEQMDEVKFKSGDKMIIIDAGGGTVDITVHEQQATGEVKEIAPPSGGPWGGINVDKKFVDVVKNILGADFINAFKSKFPQQWMQIMGSFEKAKKAAKPEGKQSIKVGLPFSFDSEYRKLKGSDVAEAIKAYRDKDVSFSNGFLAIKANRVVQLFCEVTENIISHVQTLLSNPELQGIKHILLVGGFGECSFLQDACYKGLGSSGCNVLVPMEAQLAILKGAVMFGHNPMQIISRIAKMTYGERICLPYEEQRHDPNKKLTDNKGELWARKCFDSFVVKGEEIQTGNAVIKYCQPVNVDQTSGLIELFKTDKESVVHIDEPGVIKVGQIRLKSKCGNLSDNIETCFTFGHTEILVEARDAGKEGDFSVSTTIDFLAD